MSTFSNQVVLITGAGSGLGRQLAVSLAREGAAIAAIDLTAESLTAVGAELSGTSFAWAIGDVTDRDLLHKAVAEVQQKLGRIDVLVANAGIGIANPAVPFRAADFEAQIKVNLLGVANSVEAVLPAMLERKSGHIVGISSLASYRGLPHMLGYCASKAGVSSLMEGLRVELKPHGIAVTTICPGWIKTNLSKMVAVPPEQIMELPYAASRIVEAIRRRLPYCAFPRAMTRKVRLLKWLPCGISDWLTVRAGRAYQIK
jgi:NAD(P)-dependent dehydrogenase (short-subunit alcohol dehydrogenase family)